MRVPVKFLGLMVAFILVSSTVALACHSNYFDEIFTKIQRQIQKGELDKDQIAAIWSLKKEFDNQRNLDHSERKLSCAAHDSHVPGFIAAAAGVLSDEQFEQATGQKKTEVQKLRFEVNQLKKELHEIRALLEQLKSSN